jgi:hypothetical protein
MLHGCAATTDFSLHTLPLLLLLLLRQFSFVASATVKVPGPARPDDVSNSSSSSTVGNIMVLVDQLGRLVQFPVDADGAAVPAAAYNPFDGSSQWLPAEQSQRLLCVGTSVTAVEST